MLIISDRVKESSLTTGSGAVVFDSPFGSFQSFQQGVGNGNTTYYCIENGVRWEVGQGVYAQSGNSLSRDVVFDSSASGAKINLEGVSTVFCTLPADKAIIKNEASGTYVVDISTLELNSSGIISNTLSNSGDAVFGNDILVSGDLTVVGSLFGVDDISSSGDIVSSGFLTLIRPSGDAGNFFHAYKEDGTQQTAALHMDGNISPMWKLGLKTNPDSQTAPPTFAYVFAKDGSAGVVSNTDNYASISDGIGFTVYHDTNTVFRASSLTGVYIETTSSANPSLVVTGPPAPITDLQRWSQYDDTILSVVDSGGKLGILNSNPLYEIDVNGSGRMDELYLTSGIYFQDGTFQSTAGGDGGGDGGGGEATAVSGWADTTMTSRDNAVSGYLQTYVDSQDHSAVSVSGWADTTFDLQGVTDRGNVTTSGITVSGVNLSGGTASGILYRDGSGDVQTDGPTVNASGDVAVSGSLTVADGSAAVPSINFASDTDTGWSYEGTGSIQFSSGGVKVFQLDNLGLRSKVNSGAEVATQSAATSTAPVFRFRSDTNTGIGSAGADQLSLITGGVEAIAIDASQNVSLKTLTATAASITDTPLSVNGTVGQTADIATIGSVTIDASSNLTTSGTCTSTGFRTSTAHYDPTRIWTNSLGYEIIVGVVGQTDHRIRMSQWNAAQSLYRMAIHAGDAVMYFDAPAGVEFTGGINIAADLTVGDAAIIGEWSIADWMVIRQNDQVENTGYAMVQSPTGATTINSESGQAITLQIAGANAIVSVKDTEVTFNRELVVNVPVATAVGHSITGAAAQSANLQEWNLSGGTLRASVTSAGDFSNKQSRVSSEVFGSGATSTGNYATVFGNLTTGATLSQAMGYNTRAAANSVVIGHYGGQYGFNEQCVLLGQSASSTTTNQFVAGSQYARIDNVYFGEGVSNATPTAYTINGTGGSGTDIAGADVNIAGGIGTGTGAGGDIVFKTAAAGSTGSTANTLTTAMTIDASQNATFSGSLEVPNNGVQISTSARTAGFGFSDGWPSISSTTKAEFIIDSTGPAIPSGSSYGFRSTDAVTGGAGVDTKLNRVSANVVSVTDNNGTTLGQLNVGILTATAQAITDTPLIVNGAVGQTAEVATLDGRVGISAPDRQLTLRDSDAGNASSASAYTEYWYADTSRIGYAGMISGNVMSFSTTIGGGSYEIRTANNVLALAIDSSQNATFAGDLSVGGGIHQSAEITSLPTGTTQTVTLADGNHQTLDLTSTTGDSTVTLTVPTGSSAGTIIVEQHATTARDITWALSSGTLKWLGTEPTWSSDSTSDVRIVTWRWDGAIMYLAATDVAA